MERIQKRLVGMVCVLVAAVMLMLQSGCTTTAAKPINAFQPRPFQSRGQFSQSAAPGYAQQQAFYSPYAQQYSGSPVYPQNSGNGLGTGLAGSEYNPNSVGLDLQNSRPYQSGYQATQARPWYRFGLPNVRSYNPPGFGGSTC